MNTIEKVKSLLESGDVSQSQAAKEAGISEAAVSQWLKGIYKGQARNIEDKLDKWLASREQKESQARILPEKPEWVDTPTAERITEILSYIRFSKGIGSVIGASGVGKTHTSKRFAGMYPNVWVVELAPDAESVSGSLEEVALAVGMRDIPRGAARLRRAIVAKIKGTDGLLIVDEAQFLSPRAMEEFRRIHDLADIGLVFAGNETVGAKISRFAQIFGREGQKMRLSRPLKADVLNIAKAFGANGDSADVISGIGKKPGGLHKVIETLRLAHMYAAGESAGMNARHIRAAWKRLGGEEHTDQN